MGQSIKAAIELENSQFLKGAEQVQQATRGMKNEVGGAGEKFGRHQAHLTKYAEGLFFANSATDLLAHGLEKAGKIFGLGAGLGIGAMVVANFVEKIHESQETFTKAREEHEKFQAEISKTIRFGGFDQVGDSIEKIREQQDKLIKEQKALEKPGFGQYWTNALGTLIGGDSKAEMERKLARDRGALGRDAIVATGRLTDDLDSQLEVQRLLVAGEKEKAEALKRSLEFTKEKAKVDSLPIRGQDKAGLKSQMDELERLKNQVIDRKRGEFSGDWLLENRKLAAHARGDDAGERSLDAELRRARYERDLLDKYGPEEAKRMAAERVRLEDAAKGDKRGSMDSLQAIAGGGYVSSGDGASPMVESIRDQKPILQKMEDHLSTIAKKQMPPIALPTLGST